MIIKCKAKELMMQLLWIKQLYGDSKIIRVNGYNIGKIK